MTFQFFVCSLGLIFCLQHWAKTRSWDRQWTKWCTHIQQGEIYSIFTLFTIFTINKVYSHTDSTRWICSTFTIYTLQSIFAHALNTVNICNIYNLQFFKFICTYTQQGELIQYSQWTWYLHYIWRYNKYKSIFADVFNICNDFQLFPHNMFLIYHIFCL